jgi:hypothetical protein
MSFFTPTNNQLGIQPIANTNVTLPSQYQINQSPSYGQVHPLGLIVQAYDTTLGAGEFIYLKAAVTTTIGFLATYDPSAPTSALAPNTAKSGNPVAVAMATNQPNSYGWYQVAGVAAIKKTATVAAKNSRIYISGTAGRVFTTSTAGKGIWNAITVNSVSAGISTVNVLIQRPFMEPLAT